MKDEGEGAGVSMESLRLVRQACGSREMAALGGSPTAEKASPRGRSAWTDRT